MYDLIKESSFSVPQVLPNEKLSSSSFHTNIQNSNWASNLMGNYNNYNTGILLNQVFYVIKGDKTIDLASKS